MNVNLIPEEFFIKMTSIIPLKKFINLKLHVILLIIDGKGRRPAFWQDSKSPHFTNTLGVNL